QGLVVALLADELGSGRRVEDVPQAALKPTSLGRVEAVFGAIADDQSAVPPFLVQLVALRPGWPIAVCWEALFQAAGSGLADVGPVIVLCVVGGSEEDVDTDRLRPSLTECTDGVARHDGHRQGRQREGYLGRLTRGVRQVKGGGRP